MIPKTFKRALWATLCAITLLASGCGDAAAPVDCTRGDLTGPDQDGDGVVDRCDVCPTVSDPDQADSDHDGAGDACEEDDDNDGFADGEDNCPLVLQPGQDDSDNDGIGDACDPCPGGEDERDRDNDGLNDCEDLCPFDGTSDDNTDSDGDGVGDLCDVCPSAPDAHQRDRDGDGIGDACDGDSGPFTLDELTIKDLHGALRRGEVTCLEVVERHLERIHAYDMDISDGPPLNAFVAFNPNVRNQALALDAYQAEHGALIGPMHCVPLVVKDIYDTKDTPTSSGSLSLVGAQAREDGFAVKQMRDRGAVLIATTTMDEYSRGIHGISSRSGRAGNAYNAYHNPGGSSSGSGVAVGAGFAMVGTGTDNCASLTVPASYNGLVTLRPTLGLVSMSGIFPSNRLDATAGPMTRTVTAMAVALDAMSVQDPTDDRTLDPNRAQPASYTDHLDPNGLQGKRIGILRRTASVAREQPEFTFIGADAHATRVFNRALDDMRRLGATLVDNVQLPGLDTRRGGGGFAAGLEGWFEGIDGPYDSFNDVCDGGQYPDFIYTSATSCNNEIFINLHLRSPGDIAYEDIARRYRGNWNHIRTVMDRLELDALVYPVDGIGASPPGYWSRTNCVITSVSGTPTMVVQAGRSQSGLPIGMMFLGRKYSEPTLFEISFAYEQGTQHRRPPNLTSALDLASVPVFDPTRANAFRLDLGYASYERVLATGDKFDLTAEGFVEIVRDVANARGETWRLP